MASGSCFCPGQYCGCSSVSFDPLGVDEAESLSCGRCPRGSRVNEASGFCETCENSPSFYDWLYLTSMLIILFLSHVFIIDWTVRNKFKVPKKTSSSSTTSSGYKNSLPCSKLKPNKLQCAAVLVACVSFELVISVILTLLLTHPLGSFYIKSCGSQALADWYPIFFNPKVNFSSTLYCTQEVVYPLYSLVLTLCLIDLVCMVLIRPLVTWKLNCGVEMVTYLALYFIPTLMFVHAIGAGVMYYSFPYLFLVFSVASLAFNLCLEYSRCSKDILKMCAPPPPRMIALVLLHWCLHLFAIVSVTRQQTFFDKWKVLLLTPLPTLFFFLTIKFTDPSQILHRSAISPPPMSGVGRRLGSMQPSSTSLHSMTSSVSASGRVVRCPNSGRNRYRPSSSGDRHYTSYHSAPGNSARRRPNAPSQAPINPPSYLSVVFEQGRSQNTQNPAQIKFRLSTESVAEAQSITCEGAANSSPNASLSNIR